ncbi:hypothetical protein GCM10009751_14880 [Myceligenerans crystallogenes]|uniref:Uncharacterized protein n=1 Tax=Myceligenerans crystallogenes TaxID=316335 RepID=A0ABN2N930_9MICO
MTTDTRGVTGRVARGAGGSVVIGSSGFAAVRHEHGSNRTGRTGVRSGNCGTAGRGQARIPRNAVVGSKCLAAWCRRAVSVMWNRPGRARPRREVTKNKLPTTSRRAVCHIRDVGCDP